MRIGNGPLPGPSSLQVIRLNSQYVESRSVLPTASVLAVDGHVGGAVGEAICDAVDEAVRRCVCIRYD